MTTGSGHVRRGASVVALCVLLLAGGCTPRREDARQEAPATSSAVAVTAFGAKGDGRTDDSHAFQAAVDSLAGTGGTVTVPPGTYRFARAVILGHDHVRIAGAGPASVLKLADGVTTNIFTMPVPYGTQTVDDVVTDIEITGLTLDGNRNGGVREPPTFFPIQIVHAERVVLSDLLVRDWPYDGVSIGVGQRPNVDITVRNSRFVGIGRNAVHFGYGSKLRVSDIVVEDTPSQQWGPAAGNAIDVEVEGENSFVDGFVIENSLFSRADTHTAGYGVALQPAFGPIRNGIIRGNVIRNHQLGVFVGTAEGITVERNWVVADDNMTTGAGIAVFDGTATVAGNVLNLLRWSAGNGYAGVLIHGPTTPVTVRGNRVWGGLCMLRLQAAGHAVSLQGNVWGNESGCFADPASPPALVQQSGNERRQVPALDEVPPAVRLALDEGAVVRSSATVQALPTDTGEGVARVLFLVDGLPRGFVDQAPYNLRLEGSHLAAGEHTIEARAVDNAANVSSAAGVKVRVKP